MNKGIFISFEGGDSCGKSTQINMLKNCVEASKYRDRFLFVRDPGQSPIGEDIRKILLSLDSQPHPLTELFLYLASRSELVNKIIIPALDQGKIVVCDRFYHSTIAYQGFARDILPIDQVEQLANLSACHIQPVKIFYLRLDPQIALQRKQDTHFDRMEKEGIQFREKVQNGYDYLAKKEPQRFVVIDATKSPEEIFDKIKAEISKTTGFDL